MNRRKAVLLSLSKDVTWEQLRKWLENIEPTDETSTLNKSLTQQLVWQIQYDAVCGPKEYAIAHPIMVQNFYREFGDPLQAK